MKIVFLVKIYYIKQFIVLVTFFDTQSIPIWEIQNVK